MGTPKVSKKAVILAALPAAIQNVSGGGRSRYGQRQLFYAVRPVFIRVLDQEPKWGTYCKIITAHEAALGHDLPGIYRDSRGVLYHPHTGEELPLGTLSVEKYRRPPWTFNKIIYCEKEGFFPLLKDAHWPERNDCAMLTSKGFATRAVCDVLDLLGNTGEPLTFFCIHDADGPGTVIYDAMQEGASARPKRKVNVINLGLEPGEALKMGLDPEPVKRKENKKGTVKQVPVGKYVVPEWRKWLQRNRVELNAMTTPQFIEWLDRKMAPYNSGKVIPPGDVLRQRLTDDVRANFKETIAAEILRDGRLEQRVAEAATALEPIVNRHAETLAEMVGEALGQEPADLWTAPVAKLAGEVVAGRGDGTRQLNC